MNALRLYSILGGAGAATALVVAWYVLRKRKDMEELERERRLRINSAGRITDGTVLDVSEIAEEEKPAIQLLIYNYDVAGVDYHCSQDITHLRHFVDLHTCKIGLPASVKYDPQNPGNSIVICETWSGLRT
jgi:hypothetical protein